MFWKKKKRQTDAIRLPSTDQRDAYRYQFKDALLKLSFKKKDVMVRNISAGGIAFQNKGFSPLETCQVELKLDIPNYKGSCEIRGTLRILEIDDADLCHCIFEDLSLEQYEVIHKYVLELQKNDLAH